MNKVKLILYTIYRPIFIVFLVADTAVLATLIILIAIFDRTGNISHYVGKFWSRMNMLISGVRVVLHGLENIEKGKSYVVMSNHQSHIDVWSLFGFMPMQLRWVMKIELRKIPIFGLCCERMGQFYVDRKNPARSREELDAFKKRFNTGISVVFFPEGQRSTDGVMGHFKKGGFVMAIQGQLPILPVTVNGGRQVLPSNSLHILPGVINVHIHPAIPTESYTYDMRAELMECVKTAIASKVDVD